jgi:cytochrome c553
MFVRHLKAIVPLLVLLISFVASAAVPTASQGEIDYFESNIRPIFADNCYSCHSENAKKLKGDLKLDTTEGILKGGSSGPAIVPSDPAGSLLIKAVRYTDPDLQMPPKKKKLSDDEIRKLETWVKMGAPMPQGAAPPKVDRIAEARAKHWAFKPVTKPSVPGVRNSRWIQSPIDNFVLAKLEQKNLSPAPAADRRTLIRRVTYDLIGLPPSASEVEAFVKDTSPDSFARLVDRLLASPQYGERWGRYWLDVARYADTKGYLAGGEERRYSYSYTYRDYVVRSYNEDLPYNRFITEQIAADKLPLGDDRRALAALGFLTLGRRFLGNQNDIIDDRIDVVGRGTLGLTVACARCHDHKFDPIPSRDYYALHGVFASSEEPSVEPLLSARPPDSKEYKEYLKAKAGIEAEIESFKVSEIEKFKAERRHDIGSYLLGAHDAAALKSDENLETFAGERKLNHTVLAKWIAYLDAERKSDNPVFSPWFALTGIPATNYSTHFSAALSKLSTNENKLVVARLKAEATNSLSAAANAYTKLFNDVDAAWTAAVEAAVKKTNAAPVALSDHDKEIVRLELYRTNAPSNLPRSEVETIINRRLTEGTAPIRNKIDALAWTHPGAPARAMALEDKPSPEDSHILKRGNPGNPGELAPRRFLEILSQPGDHNFTNGSGRLELAEAITRTDNPLTARVYVNRIWLHHFGEGLVSTPGDFGIRTEEPVQRDLLDFLAASFIEHGWSTKYLHRLILLSSTWQQSAEASTESLKVDPDNRLLSHFNRQRLDFEAMRDTLLADGGKIDLKAGGLPVDILAEPYSMRRTLYAYIDRQNLPGLFRTFDFANPDISNQGRFRTTVPQQALFMMNSPFVAEQARNVTHRPEVAKATTPGKSIRELYRVILQRPPSREEMSFGEKFLNLQGAAKSSKFSPIEKYAQVLLLSNEVMFVD